MRAMIWAQSPDRVIGVNGTIPWRHPGDVRRFKRLTLGSSIVMGRATFESMGSPLPKRRNVVVTSRPLTPSVPGVECVRSIHEALDLIGSVDMWFVGGAQIYVEGMAYVDLIDVTYVPDSIDAPNAVRAPLIDEAIFEPSPLLQHEDEPALSRRTYRRRAAAPPSMG